ncbi:MAG: leucyl/phenylalanyl-tRNA--protein transferase [Micavibrio sp.]|nr:leucyl/phenylalanyl-tRNA--protein transferase [Micavibrio sp.]
MQVVLTPELLIEAYKQGLFPMAYSADSPYVHWICPDDRGQLSITDMHIPRSLRKAVRQNLRNDHYKIKTNTDFPAVIAECAATTTDRPETWINPLIMKAYINLHRKGYAHSVECWQDDELVGGLYGVAIGSAFFGESMFARATNASKIALVHLVARLWKGGFTLLDTQFTNAHLEQFNVYEVPHDSYLSRLKETVQNPANFNMECSEREILESYFDMRANI